MSTISYQTGFDDERALQAEPAVTMNLRLLAALFWRTLPFLLPVWRHFLLYYALVAVMGLIQLGGFFLFYDLLLNKVFLAQPLTELQSNLLALDPAQFALVDALSLDSRMVVRDRLAAAGSAVLLSGILLGALTPYYLTWILQRINQALRTTMVANAEKLSLRYHADSRVGDAIYRVFQDSAMITSIVQNILITPSVLIVSLLFNVAVVALFAPYLALLCALGALPLILLVGWFTPRLRIKSMAARSSNSALTSEIQESMSNLKVIKANAQVERVAERFEERSVAALRAAYRLRRSLALMTLGTVLITAAVILGADYMMAGWALTGEETFAGGAVALVGFTIWNLGSFQAARSRLTNVSGSAFDLTYLYGVAQDMAMGLARSFLLLDLRPDTPERPDARSVDRIVHDLRFQGVDFSYDKAAPTLRQIDLTLTRGTVTALVGPTGAGKTTLVNLMLRLYDPDRGSVSIDGVDLRELRIDDLRKTVAVALQENILFAATVADNIRYAAPGATDPEVAEAARIACADRFIAELPLGFATELGERGSKLSSGQRQRLSIARAILKEPSLLILDEPTAALDAATEARVLDNLAEWGRERILLLITHRVATIRRADQILFIEDGEIVEAGSHGELARIPDGRYSAFVARQGQAARSER